MQQTTLSMRYQLGSQSSINPDKSRPEYSRSGHLIRTSKLIRACSNCCNASLCKNVSRIDEDAWLLLLAYGTLCVLRGMIMSGETDAQSIAP